MGKSITILVSCDDARGIIAKISNFILNNGGNIIYVDQYVDREQIVFFMRLESEFYEERIIISELEKDFQTNIAEEFKMKWKFYDSSIKPKMALFVSKYSHCLYDILSRYNLGELNVEIPLIISNHKTLEDVAENFKIPFFHIEVNPESKLNAEQQQLELLTQHKIDFIVLARYMQIVSPNLINKYPNKIINIHHSFLPAFVGAKPYHSAFKRGVKIIGATSHYVTEELDAGPIIAQDVTTVTHTHSIEDLIAKGRNLEKIVLSDAIKLHSHRKVMVYNNKTVVFS